MKNEEDLRRDGSAHDILYLKVCPPNLRASSPAEIAGTTFL